MIIVGDVHGNFDTLMALLSKIPEDQRSKGIVFVGDLIDRGPKSRQVVEWVIDNAQSVTGNHELMMIENGIDTFDNNTNNFLWHQNGGKECVDSYRNNRDLFLSHLEWMKTLPLYLEYKDVKNDKNEHLLVTHSSAHSVWKWTDKRRKEQFKIFQGQLVWGRPTNILPINDIFNVFGHTPIPNGPRLKSCYANIDTGCFYNHREYFKLTALQFPEMVVYEQECVDTPIYKVF